MQTANQQSNSVVNLPRDEGQFPSAYEGGRTGSAALILDGSSMERMIKVADMMASAAVTIPQHLRGKPGDCLAVVMQSVQWGMNPFAVAQKTHLSQSGALGYEAQLINAVVVACGSLTGQPEFEFLGDWTKILGKVEERKSDKGGKYYVAAWNKADEEGLGVICTATLRGEKVPRSVTIMLSQCWPRFSTQWATDPQQQITYVGVRKFSRRYCPGAILGVYTPEELDERPAERDITSESEILDGAGRPATAKDALRGAATRGQAPAVTLQQVTAAFAAASSKEEMKAAFDLGQQLTAADDQKAARAAYDARVAELKARVNTTSTSQTSEAGDVGHGPSETQAGNGAPQYTYAQVEDKLRKAQDEDQLAEAADLIQYVPGAVLQGDLGGVFKRRREELRGKA